MVAEHIRRIRIDQRVDLDVRQLGFQRGNDWRCQQDIAEIAKLDHQYAADLVMRNGIRRKENIGQAHVTPVPLRARSAGSRRIIVAALA